MRRVLKAPNLEAAMWIAALAALAASDPRSKRHVTAFPPALLFGVRSPGYNLGHSMAFLLHGEVRKSWRAHPLGIPATLLIVYRIASLMRKGHHQEF